MSLSKINSGLDMLTILTLKNTGLEILEVEVVSPLERLQVELQQAQLLVSF